MPETALPTLLPIGALDPGTRFRLAALPEKAGVVLRIGPGAALVCYGQPRHVALPNGREFDAQPGATTISLATIVIVEPA